MNGDRFFVRALVSLGLATLVLGACGPGVERPEDVHREPLLTIYGRLAATREEIDVLAQALNPMPDASLVATTYGPAHVALVWASRPPYARDCALLPAGHPLADSCPDADTFTPSEATDTVELAADGSFALPVYSLPPIELTVGAGESRLAYGSIVAYLPYASGTSSHQANLTAGALFLASTFATTLTTQRRVVYREGDFIAERVLYPLPSCPTPPRGFSILAIGATPADGTPQTCETVSITQAQELSLLDAAASLELSCRWYSTGVAISPASMFNGSSELDLDLPSNTACLDANNLLLVLPTDRCTHVEIISLRGCYDEGPCEQPDFDETANPPRWWPC